MHDTQGVQQKRRDGKIASKVGSSEKKLESRRSIACSKKISEKRKSEFWERVNILDDESCWDWKRGKDRDGYGQIRINGTTTNSHRIAWILTAKSRIPNRLCVLHSCDNPSCCNPAHLFLGTNRQNVSDRNEKGRQAKGEKLGNIMRNKASRGEGHHQSKLTNSSVLLMRNLSSSGWTLNSLSRKFKVCIATVHNVVSRKFWRHV